MGKKVHLINEVGQKIEVESCAIAGEQTTTSVMNEMARINTKEDGSNIFPYNAFNVHILSTDHKLPHFHILSNGWNISFYISNGELYKINKKEKIVRHTNISLKM